MAITDLIHPVYDIWFRWIDPILTASGMWGNFFAHDLAMQSFFTNYPPTEHLKSFLYQIGGMGTSYLILQTTLLRYTHDVNIWKMVQLAIIPADFTMFAAIYNGMRIEGNLALANWRPIDWISIVITALCTILRVAFVLGVGIKKTKGNAAKRV
ncbi:hypothetical protein FSARC_11674 [Fusarium sarcochroum]|uniref:DUF7704 domain-containing protein n=1 Tax=Fusarium sarcochroum TaxID=1208366 RepID=A0A8H4TE65_9HYPO|nr:hypothetical protein FSARC_11674 [Fusarium sarcochroum]